jgi:hypothetical protein
VQTAIRALSARSHTRRCDCCHRTACWERPDRGGGIARLAPRQDRGRGFHSSSLPGFRVRNIDAHSAHIWCCTTLAKPYGPRLHGGHASAGWNLLRSTRGTDLLRSSVAQLKISLRRRSSHAYHPPHRPRIDVFLLERPTCTQKRIAQRTHISTYQDSVRPHAQSAYTQIQLGRQYLG